MTLRDHLRSGVTTICYCWVVRRVDGTVTGFTDHDADVVVGDTLCLSTTGITTTRLSQSLGLAPNDVEIEGAIDDDQLTEDDILAGRYDNAAVELYLVNWSDSTEYELLIAGEFGDVTQGDGGKFQTSFLSNAFRLNQPTGETFQRTCNRELGDAGCGVDLSDPSFRVDATVIGISGTAIAVLGLGGFADEWFALGTVQTESGATLGVRNSNSSTVFLWEAPPVTIEIGDTLTVTAGCKLDAGTCVSKFNNIANFLGFNFMPGNDTLTTYPIRGAAEYDGGSLFSDE